MFRLPVELQYHILGYCNIQEIATFARSSPAYGVLARTYVRCWLDVRTTGFFSSTNTLLHILRCCDAVVSGSCALHLVLPANLCPWAPRDLDIYVSKRHLSYLSSKLESEGYKVDHEDCVNDQAYSMSTIRTVCSFTNGSHTLDVISPIFQFHSTAVMNFFSADSIFCGYPNLTFHLLALINPKPVYFRLVGWKSMAAVHKYVTRGFEFVDCEMSHQYPYSCRSIPRTLTDNGTVWITMDLSRDVGTSGLAFDHLGVLNVLWFMGGYICGTEPTFVKGYTWVIEDDS
ncbi:hypothetical protein BKA82DRAFT_3982497 [Pisolithus tinctorius]|nr:hypothetical protein BKA82DRAFT_3982497 [Pisolithus tinctorius]